MFKLNFIYHNVKLHETKNQIAGKKKKNTHWILKPKVWDSSKQDTFWDGRGVSGAFGKYYLFITSWLDNDSSKKKKSFFQSIQVKHYHHT